MKKYEQFSLKKEVLGTDLSILRALPNYTLRTVGAWCFLDHIGPVRTDGKKKVLDIGPHPHIGLQTLTWMISGTILHKDSLGSIQNVSAGGINLMTAGHGITHTEESCEGEAEDLHSVQLWIALPEEEKNRMPSFDHYSDLPSVHHSGLFIQVLVGEFLGEKSPVTVYSPLVAAELYALGHSSITLPLDSEFEYGLLVLTGAVAFDGVHISAGEHFIYFARGHSVITLNFQENTRIMLIGGTPCAPVLHWWNFIARVPEDMIIARDAWVKHQLRFGDVPAYDGKRMEAPTLSARFLSR